MTECNIVSHENGCFSLPSSDIHRLVKSINTVATTNFRNGNLDRALAFYKEAALLARSDRALLQPYDDKGNDFRDEETVARLVQSTILLASTLNSIAVILWCRGLFDQSRDVVSEAVDAIETAGPRISVLVLPTSPRQLQASDITQNSYPHSSMKQLFTDLKWVKCTTMFNQGILSFLECDYRSATKLFEATLRAQKTLLGNKKTTHASNVVGRTQEYLALCRKKLLKA